MVKGGVFVTELMKVRLSDKQQFDKILSEFSDARLLAELDDTIQIDLLKMSTVEYLGLSRDRISVYQAILKELSTRLDNRKEF